MKKYVTLFALFSLCFGVLVQAQKFGHINVQGVIDLMSDRDSALVKYQKYYAEIEENFVFLQNEYQSKLTDFQQKQATWTGIIKETKERELFELQQRAQQFQQNAPQDLEQMQNILFAPVYAKANEAIKKVAKELGLIYVFNSSGTPYIDESQSVDLLPKVKAELKIPAEKVSPTPIGDQPQR